MALLGTFWNAIGPVTAAPVTGGAAIAAVAGYNHSLPTTPEVVVPVMRSLGVAANNGIPALIAQPGNASQVTVGYVLPSVASHPTIAFDIYAAMIHSSVR